MSTEPATTATTVLPSSSTIAGVEPPPGVLISEFGVVGWSGAHLLDRGKGWIVSGASVKATADNGHTWSLGFQAPKDSWIVGDGQFGGTGWLVLSDRSVYASIDDGVHWERRGALPAPSIGIGPTNVSFVDDQRGWAAVHVGGGANDATALYVTVDGGMHWAALPTVAASGGISFITPSDGWTVEVFSQQLLRTSDGGKTWTVQSLPSLVGAFESEPAFIGPPRFAGSVGAEFVGHGGFWRAPVLLLTGDTGLTWRSVPVSLPAPASTPYGSSSDMSASLALVDAQHIRIADETRIDVTDDGGRTWSARDTPLPVSSVLFVDADHGWAFSNTSGCRGFKTDCWEATSLLATSDAGATWTTVPLPTTNT